MNVKLLNDMIIEENVGILERLLFIICTNNCHN